jgi:DNA polymerase
LSTLRAGGAPVDMLDFLSTRRVVDVSSSMAEQVRRFLEGPERVYTYLRFAGAHTGRFSSGGALSGRVNIHGLAKGSPDVPEARELRQIFVPDDGEVWVAGDLATIEPRVLAFVAGEQDLLARFAEGVDVYLWFAGHAFAGQRVEKDGENAHLRRAAKQAVLGLGFGMGVTTFGARLVADGLVLSGDAVRALHEKYNEVFPVIRTFRERLLRAAVDVARGSDPIPVGDQTIVRRGKTPGVVDGRTLVIDLPTGRRLHYHAVRVTTEGTRDGRRRQVLWAAHPLHLAPAAPSVDGRDTVSSADDQWRRFSDGIVRRRLTAPILVENVVQAIARDVLVAMAAAAEERGLRVVLHVHDEIIAAVPACGCTGAHHGCSWRRGQDILRAVMSTPPPSLLALAGLPLACDINERVCTSYAP